MPFSVSTRETPCHESQKLVAAQCKLPLQLLHLERLFLHPFGGVSTP